jgi:hypothetical protein
MTLGEGEYGRTPGLPRVSAAADREDQARPLSGADEDVLGVRREVNEVPRVKWTFLPLDQQERLAGQASGRTTRRPPEHGPVRSCMEWRLSDIRR